MTRSTIGPLPLHPTVRLTHLTRAHTAALVTAAAEAGERAFVNGGRWAVTTPEYSYIGGHLTTANFVFGEAWESPVQWLDRHIDRYPPGTRVGRLLRTVRQRLLDHHADRVVSWRGGPQLDPATEDGYQAEQADYE
ncbi:hypothetical protein HD597_011336 [Nonomuraea thailandensis]|uniref:Uncharacterized protein n=1 Tax=Nonomuraea thailandensis TaxID=1188745 RepID=A0A9X2KBT4_9ACTN|nr:hypothetical protein [Nonomuraea thailandensis]MCP2364316.1 hypothetical protein [Nonomuraea thailandensis]